MDNETYRRVAGVDSQVARSELRDLVSRGLVMQVGSNRWTRYQLATVPVPSSSKLHRQRTPRADRRQELLSELAAGPLSRSELEHRIGLSPTGVRRWLGILRDEGLIEPTEEAVRSPGVRYRRVSASSD